MWDFPCRTVFFFSLFYGMISDGHYMAPALGSTSKNGAWQMEKKAEVGWFYPIFISKRKISELVVFNVFRQLQSFLGFVMSFLRSSPWPKPKGDHPQI